jgi:hypothetical protein
VGLVADRGLLLSLMHGFVLGRDPLIGAAAREGFIVVYRFLRHEAGFSPDESQQFLAAGMLINTMIGLRMTDDFDRDSDVHELLTNAFPEKIGLMLDLAAAERAESAARAQGDA